MIDEVQLGIVRQPAPHGGSTLLPGRAGPARRPLIGRRVAAAVERLESWADLDVPIWPDVVRAPDLLSRCGVERGDPAAHAHLAAARTDDDFPLYDDGRHGHRLAVPEAAHACLPEQPAARGIDADGVAVQQVVE